MGPQAQAVSRMAGGLGREMGWKDQWDEPTALAGGMETASRLRTVNVIAVLITPT